MVDVFSGGLIYEFTQEPNNYGLIQIEDNGNVQLLPDYFALKSQYQSIPDIDYQRIAINMRMNSKELQAKAKTQKYPQPQCQQTYDNLDISKGVPPSIADNLIERGVDVHIGKFVEISDSQLHTKFGYSKSNGEVYQIDHNILRVNDHMSGLEVKGKNRAGGFQNCTYDEIDNEKFGDEVIDDDYNETEEDTEEYTDEDDTGESSNPFSIIINKVSDFVHRLSHHS